MGVIRWYAELQKSTLDLLYCTSSLLLSASLTNSWVTFLSRQVVLASYHNLFAYANHLYPGLNVLCGVVHQVRMLTSARPVVTLMGHAPLTWGCPMSLICSFCACCWEGQLCRPYSKQTSSVRCRTGGAIPTWLRCIVDLSRELCQ